MGLKSAMGRDPEVNRDLPQNTASGARNGVYKGLSRGHPGKPYYEAMDDVGVFLEASLRLQDVGHDDGGVSRKSSIKPR